MSVKKGVFFSLPKKMSEKTSTTAATLGKLAFLNLTHSSWSLLDAHIQYCIFPYHQALTVLQSKIRLHVRETRQKMDLFLSLLDGQNQLERLRPQRSVKYPTLQMIARITPGDHIAFRFWGIYHHGIVLERPDDGMSWFVADFSSPSGDMWMCDAELRRRSLDDFMRGVLEFWIIPYDEHGIIEKERTIQIANFMVAEKLHMKAPYHCLRNNCETFAVLCKTGNLDNKGSDQGRILGEAIRRDLERENDSLLLHVLGASILYAQRFFVTRNN